MAATLILATDMPAVGKAHSGVPMDEYHRWNAASNSRLSKLRRSPAHLQAYLSEEHQDTKATRIGRAAHTTILEPELFDSTFRVAEQCLALTAEKKRCSKMGVMYYGDLLGWRCGTPAHSKDLPTPDSELLALPESEFVMCQKMRVAVARHHSASRLLGARAEVELSLLWDDEATGVRCKARLDCLSPEIAGGAIVDIKSTRNAQPDAFEKSIMEHGYHRQGAHYLKGARACGLTAEHFVIIAVEKEPPYAVAVYRLTEGALDAGEQQLNQLLATYAQCLETDVWPAYPDVVQDIALPTWAWAQIDRETGESA